MFGSWRGWGGGGGVAVSAGAHRQDGEADAAERAESSAPRQPLPRGDARGGRGAHPDAHRDAH